MKQKQKREVILMTQANSLLTEETQLDRLIRWKNSISTDTTPQTANLLAELESEVPRYQKIGVSACFVQSRAVYTLFWDLLVAEFREQIRLSAHRGTVKMFLTPNFLFWLEKDTEDRVILFLKMTTPFLELSEEKQTQITRIIEDFFENPHYGHSNTFGYEDSIDDFKKRLKILQTPTNKNDIRYRSSFPLAVLLRQNAN